MKTGMQILSEIAKIREANKAHWHNLEVFALGERSSRVATLLMAKCFNDSDKVTKTIIEISKNDRRVADLLEAYANARD